MKLDPEFRDALWRTIFYNTLENVVGHERYNQLERHWFNGNSDSYFVRYIHREYPSLYEQVRTVMRVVEGR